MLHKHIVTIPNKNIFWLTKNRPLSFLLLGEFTITPIALRQFLMIDYMSMLFSRAENQEKKNETVV